jgi:tetratricopeptide (TPR) repeat protein
MKSSPSPEHKKPYHLVTAENRVHGLREMALRQVARILEERGWTQAETASHLGVRQPRISNLVRGKIHEFSLDSLVEMLFALDQPVTLTLEDPKTWARSRTMPKESDHPEALENLAYYTRAIANDPSNARSYSRRATAYWHLRQYDRAIADCTRWSELDPRAPGALANRSCILRDAGQLNAALEDCDEILRRFPDYNIYQNRSLIYESLGDFERALEDMNRAVERSPERPGPWTNRAALHEKLGRLEDALSDYEQALEVDPTSHPSRQAAARLREKLASPS